MLFLKRMITDDEKWITYDNRTRKRMDKGRREGTSNREIWIDDEEGDVCVVRLKKNRSL